MEEVARRGSLHGIPGVPDDARAVFKTAHEIHWSWHVRHQAAFQQHTDNGVSKTINLPTDAGEGDVAEAYLLAWREGCLGITVFRDGCKGEQVLNVGVGGDTLARSPVVLRQDGMLLSVAGVPSAQACSELNIRCPKWSAQNPRYAGEQLTKLGQLFDAGKLDVTIEAVFPLADANKALELSETGRARGKIIVKVRD